MKKFVILFTIVMAIGVCLPSFRGGEEIDKAGLGKLLFFDPLLSKSKKISCATCHKPEYAFADTSPVSIGFKNRRGSRNTPTAMNLLLQQIFFWDGRAQNLEEQALEPIENPVEMNLPVDSAIRRLRFSKKYSEFFMKVFKTAPNRENLAAAIAAFERTLETSDSPFDNWKFSDDSNAVNESAKRGFVLFNTKGKCNICHFGSDFTQHEFRNIGLFNGKNFNDSGRMVITGKQEDLGRFKTPSLRNVAVTAPYMHNGLVKTLDDVIDFYNEPDKIVANSINRDSVLAKPLGLTKEEKMDIKEFLMALTDKRFAAMASKLINR
jgi:cytochrome c peroxidase